MDYQTIAAALAAAARTCTFTGGDNLPRQLAGDGFAREVIDPPAFEVGELAIDEDQSFDAGDGAIEVGTFTCRIYASRASDAEAGNGVLRQLLASRGPSSIKAALEADRTLGGVVHALVVKKRTGYGMYEVAGTTYLGARIDVEIWGRG